MFANGRIRRGGSLVTSPHCPFLLRPGCAQLRRDRGIFLRRQLPPRRGRTGRAVAEKRNDMEMRVVNGLIGAQPIVLADSKTGCPQALALGDASFLHSDHQVPQFVRLEIKYVPRTDSFRDHQHVPGATTSSCGSGMKTSTCSSSNIFDAADSALLSRISCAMPFSGSYLPSRPVSVPGGGISLGGICAANGAASRKSSAAKVKNIRIIFIT